jgi:lipopolysaccharide export system protein LptC
MSDYTHEWEDEPEAAPAGRRIRFDPTQERGPGTFDKAYRHSSRVRGLKILLPAVAAAGVASFFILMQMAPESTDAAITLSGVNVEEKSVEMEKPHILGFEESRRSYQVDAARAFQDLANPKVVRLEEIVAKFGVGSGATATVNAALGVFDGGTKGLVLKNGITLTTTNGYTAVLKEAAIEMENGHLKTEMPVEIKGSQGTIKANAMEVFDRGARVVFSKGVSVIYLPADERSADDAAAAKDKKDDGKAKAPKDEADRAPIAAAPEAAEPAPADGAGNGPT